MIQNSSRVFLWRGLLMAAILVVSCGALWAQNDAQSPAPMRGRGGNPERELQQLTQVLSLTPDQQTQVKGLLAERRQKMEALRNSSSDASTQATPSRREQMESIRNDTDTKISALLNDDQKTKFAAWQQERKARMEQHQGGGPGGAPPPQPNN
jgi:Spy/CpxP family protein refolding chaperone